jgi:heparanase 1
MGPNAVDVFSYHFYGSISSRCAQGPAADRGTSPDAALGEDWLSRTDKVEAFYVKLRDQYEPGKPIWLSETGQAACGGDRWASTFLDSFRYVDQMGSLARRGVQVIMHNTLAASDYALIDDKTMMPRPNYWAALLWHNTMGTTVLNPGPSPSETTHLYAQCMKGHAGGVTLLALNLDRNAAATLMLGARSMRYTLTAVDLLGQTVQLNGAELGFTSADDVPKPAGVSEAKGTVNLPAASITFFTMPEAHNVACAKD